jgi:uncharacterized membrane protein YdjX (TVP38/TMEM64 family)
MDAKRRRIVRLVALAAVVIALGVVGAATGMRERFTVENLRRQALGTGAWGVLAYCAAFCAGELLYVPGTVFLVAAVLAWGRLAGGVIAFVASMLAVTATFVLVRGAGGKPLGESKRPWLRRMLAGLDAHPIWVVFVLRLIFWTSPPVNYALGLSSLRLRDHTIGSALGLVLPVVSVALFTEAVLRMLS